MTKPASQLGVLDLLDRVEMLLSRLKPQTREDKVVVTDARSHLREAIRRLERDGQYREAPP